MRDINFLTIFIIAIVWTISTMAVIFFCVHGWNFYKEINKK